MTTPTNQALPDHTSESTVWLLSMGDDGMSSQLVTGWTALRRAWLDNHRSFVDHDNLTDVDLETLSILDDDDAWAHDNAGARFSIHVSYEGDWISAIRVDNGETLRATSQPGGVPDAWRDVVDGETVRVGDRILSNGIAWSLLDAGQTHIVGHPFDSKHWRPVQRLTAAPTPPAAPDDDVEPLAQRLNSWLVDIKAAHDESLDDEAASGRAILRGVIAEMEEAVRSSAPPAAGDEAKRCTYCDGTGDVVNLIGEWRGVCTQCDAAQSAEAGKVGG